MLVGNLVYTRCLEAWPSIAEHHIAQEGSYADFIEKLVAEELKAKTQRTKAILLKFAGLPNIKTLEEYDFNLASGVNVFFGKPLS